MVDAAVRPVDNKSLMDGVLASDIALMKSIARRLGYVCLPADRVRVLKHERSDDRWWLDSLGSDQERQKYRAVALANMAAQAGQSLLAAGAFLVGIQEGRERVTTNMEITELFTEPQKKEVENGN